MFTGQLLKALQEGLADQNGDGFITFSELNSYIQVAASRWNQTPGTVELPGHQQGEFVFVNSNRKPTSSFGQVSIGRFRSADGDIYELLKTGKQFFQQKNFSAALGPFREAAEMGNAEAMTYLGAMYSHGYGIPRDQDKALGWYQAAAERGDILAMKSLVVIYSSLGDDPPNPSWNPTEAAHWRLAVAEAERLANAIVLLDPSGRADRGEPTIPPSAVIAAPLAAPTNLRFQ